MTPPFRLTFPKSPSSTYPEAVRLAKQGVTYRELLDGRRLVHEATFGVTPQQLGALRDSWELVRSWKAARLEVDGVSLLPSERWTFLQLLECMTKAATMAPPQRYCTSALVSAASRWPGRPSFPCRWLVLGGGWGPALDDQVDWADVDRRMDQLRAILLDRGVLRCPFLQMGAFEEALAGWRPTIPSTEIRRPGPRLAGIEIRLTETEAEDPAPDVLPPITPDTVDEVLRQLHPPPSSDRGEHD